MIETPAKRAKIFVTGASGCVGQYVVDRLLADETLDVVALVRDQWKVPDAWKARGRLVVAVADMRDTDALAPWLDGVDVAVLLAAGWGGAAAFDVNVTANLALSRALVARGCKRIFYFATASVLSHNGGLLKDAETIGTDYIRSKYQLVTAMESGFANIEAIGFFPTLVVGGDGVRPDSHVVRLLREAAPWAWLIAQFRVEARFHFIHAEDIARVVGHLASAGERQIPRRIILGVAALDINSMFAVLANAMGARTYVKIPITRWVARALIFVFRIQLSPWDAYCAEHPDQSFDTTLDPSSFGLETYCPDAKSALVSVGVGTTRSPSI